MRYKGRITEWQDERGFGFITPMSGGDRIFAHIKSFKHRGRRPVGGELVTYEVEIDPRGRPRGLDIEMAGANARPRPTAQRGTGSSIFAAMFLALVAVAVISDRLPLGTLIAYVVSSVITYFAYAWDKSAAKNDRWRTKESTLQMLGLPCGWPGAIFAQKQLRHQSRKQSFQLTFWGSVVVNCAAFAWVFTHPEAVWR